MGDYYMPVGTTGIQFVACIPGYVREWGIAFEGYAKTAAELRAASTMAHMGMVRGVTLRFMREGAHLTEAAAAAIIGCTTGDLSVWEAEIVDTPRLVWQHLAEYVAKLDGKIGLVEMHYPEPDYRPRVIRVVPDYVAPGGPVVFYTPGECDCPC